MNFIEYAGGGRERVRGSNGVALYSGPKNLNMEAWGYVIFMSQLKIIGFFIEV